MHILPSVLNVAESSRPRRSLLPLNLQGPLVPTATWCPFHMYRSSTDIRPEYVSLLTNINTIPALAAKNLSTQGCWAYPDMLG